MRIIEREPCQTCPYRRDAPVELWHREEFEKLQASDQLRNGALYGCHKYGRRPRAEQSFCAGWLLDQQRRNFPCLQLRVRLLQGAEFEHQLADVHAGGAPLYDSIEEMCAANGVVRENPYDLSEDQLRYLSALRLGQRFTLMRRAHRQMRDERLTWSEAVAAVLEQVLPRTTR